MKNKFYIFILLVFCFITCREYKNVDITPHVINPRADEIFQQAVSIIERSYDLDSTRFAISLLNSAIAIDSINPDYYGIKAKLLSEIGLLDSALSVQKHADEINAINGEYLFQLGLFQSAKKLDEEAHETFKRSNENLNTVLKKYPDSLGAFIIQQASYSLMEDNDSLFMEDIMEIRNRFPNRLMEIEMTRRLKPSSLIKQLQGIEREKMIEDIISGLDVVD